jgi:hypothetical protein
LLQALNAAARTNLYTMLYTLCTLVVHFVCVLRMDWRVRCI